MRSRIALLAAAGLIAACSTEPSTPVSLTETQAVASAGDDGTAALEALGDAVNAALEAQGAAYRLHKAELFDGEGAEGIVVVFNNRGNKHTGADWVPGDPRRGGHTNLTYVIDELQTTTDGGLTATQTSAAIERALATWEGVSCSTIGLTRVNLAAPTDLGIRQFLFGFGGAPFVLADITYAGWLPGFQFNPMVGNIPNVLAVTFTFAFVDANGLTDINNDGQVDVAFAEIYYNNAFAWRVNADVDIETVTLHETGHALSQAHFGTLFITESNLKAHFAPRVAMNAGYSGLQQELSGPDIGGHCSNWATWPNQ